jgi:hypothetical protein
MNKQPEALRLAEYLDLPHIGQHKSAAELRRLHGLDFALRDCELALQKMATKYMDAVDQRDALLEALKDAARCVQNNYMPDFCGHDWDDLIAKAEGEPK